MEAKTKNKQPKNKVTGLVYSEIGLAIKGARNLTNDKLEDVFIHVAVYGEDGDQHEYRLLVKHELSVHADIIHKEKYINAA